MEIQKAKTHYLDVEELLCKILGLDYEAIDADFQVIEEKLYEDLEMSTDSFHEIVNRLLPLIDVANSPMTDKQYKGFSDAKKNAWFVKMETELKVIEELPDQPKPTKRLLAVCDDMIVDDTANDTKNLRISNTLLSADLVSQGGKITMGVDRDSFHQIINDKYKVLLLVINKEEYEKRINP